MKIEHITAGSNHTALRDTADIDQMTYEILRPCIVMGENPKIPNTPFCLKTTIDPTTDAAAFDLMLGEIIAFTTFCSFSAVGATHCMNAIRQLAKLRPEDPDPVQPRQPLFLYSKMIFPAIPPSASILAGEIEFYIYETIRQYGYYQS